MKVFVICSKVFYDRINPIKEQLKKNGHTVELPVSFDRPTMELEVKKLGHEEHAHWKAKAFKEQTQKVAANDAVLVLNFEKKGIPNYIGGATFLEVYKAFELEKKIFFYNPLPEGILFDELEGMSPKIINSDLTQVKD